MRFSIIGHAAERKFFRYPLALQHLSPLRGRPDFCYIFAIEAKEEDVDIALKLNVVAVFAVFVFVGAILLGAF